MKKTLTRIFGLALLVTALPAFADIVWDFPDNSNPSAGTGTGTGNALVTPGAFGEGYQSGNPYGLGTRSGYWDMGQSGTILLSGITAGTYYLNVGQWVDSPLYSGTMTASINGGSPFTLSFQQIYDSTLQGNWENHTFATAFNLSPSDTILITGASGGAIVDRVMLTVVPEPATLIAGALLLLPFAFSTIRFIRRNKAAQQQAKS